MAAKIILTTIILLIMVGLFVFIYDKRRLQRIAQGKIFPSLPELNWGQPLKHDIITYFVPVLILVLPLLGGRTPNLVDFLQAAFVFLVLSKLRHLYWQ